MVRISGSSGCGSWSRSCSRRRPLPSSPGPGRERPPPSSGARWCGSEKLLHHVTWSINSICHTLGERPFTSRDFSGNVWWLAIQSGGESWHNLHHADPTSARHLVRRWHSRHLRPRHAGSWRSSAGSRPVSWPSQEPDRLEDDLAARSLRAPGTFPSLPWWGADHRQGDVRRHRQPRQAGPPLLGVRHRRGTGGQRPAGDGASRWSNAAGSPTVL